MKKGKLSRPVLITIFSVLVALFAIVEIAGGFQQTAMSCEGHQFGSAGLLDITGLPYAEIYRGDAYLIERAGLVHDGMLLAKRPETVSEIKKPADGTAVSGDVKVRGSATCPGFTHYTLSYTSSGDPDNFTLIGEYSVAVSNNKVLGTWQVGGLPDGDYVLKLEVFSSAGLVVQDQSQVRVDNTLPFVDILSPLTEDVVQSTFDVVGTATDANLTNWRLTSVSHSPRLLCHFNLNTVNERTDEEGDVTGNPLYADSKFGDGIVIATQAGVAYPVGAHKDININKNTGTIEMWVAPLWFVSPADTNILFETETRDRNNPTDSIRIQREGGSIFFYRYDKQGRARYCKLDLADEILTTPKPFHLAAVWSDNSNMALYLDGHKSTIVEGDGSGAISSLGENIYVGFYPGAGLEACVAFDDLTIYDYARPDAAIWTDCLSETPKNMGEGSIVRAEGDEPLLNAPAGTTNTTDAPGEALKIRLTATDGANTSVKESDRVFIDNHSPAANITSPEENQLVTGELVVSGTAFDMDFSTYALSYKEGNDPAGPGDWTDITSSDQQVWDDTLGTWNTAGLADDTYTLRLKTTDRSNHVSYAYRTFDLNSTGPLALITSPAPQAGLYSVQQITGTATDHWFDYCELHYAPGWGEHEPEDWVQIGDRKTEPVEDGELGTWDTNGLDLGEYTIRLRVVDEGGTEATCEVQVLVVGIPTSKITAPSGGDLKGGTVEITGTAADPSFSSYTVDAAPGNPPDDSPEWQSVVQDTTTPVEDGLICIWDTGGLNGEYTVRLTVKGLYGQVARDRVTLSLDNTSPQAALSAPTEGAYLTGVYGITGTASDDNFNAYVLEYGGRDEPIRLGRYWRST